MRGTDAVLRAAAALALLSISVCVAAVPCGAQSWQGLQRARGDVPILLTTNGTPVAARSLSPTIMSTVLADTITTLIKQAPRKQVDLQTGAVNSEIGRTPGAACEAIRFLAHALTIYPDRDDMRRKLVSLSDWVIGLQSHDPAESWFGGVPSTPDLQGAAAHYYYTIDAAFCGKAMFAAHDATGDHRYLTAVYRFADFLLAMHRGPSNQRAKAGPIGFCEYIISGQEPVWNCDNYVKSIVALPVLAEAARLKRDERYARAAANARTFLLPGLAGAWEYATAKSLMGCDVGGCRPKWRRIEGPHHERNWFVYGDTLAYSMRALFEYEGPSDTVRKLYAEFSTYRGKGRAASYDGRIAFAGYMKPATREADEDSAYYDLVTLGILHELRRAIAPDDFRLADHKLRTEVMSAAARSWKLDFDLRVQTDAFADMSAIANLAEAYLLSEAK